jgi:hypothetical protein
MSTDLNSEDVSAALLLVDKAEKALKAALVARDYPGISVYSSPRGFSIHGPTGTGIYAGGKTFNEALAYIAALPTVWTPSLCEQTLYAGVAA